MNFPPNMPMMAQQGMGMQRGQPMQQQPGMQQQHQQQQQQQMITPQTISRLYSEQYNQLQQDIGNWRSALTPQDRFMTVQELTTAIKLAKGLGDSPALMGAFQLERNKLFAQSQTRDQYFQQKTSILQDIQVQRQANINNNGMGLGGQMHNQQRPGGAQMGQTLSNQSTPVPQAFNPQLRQPMQASPLPGYQNNNNMGLNAPQMQNQASQQGNVAAQILQQKTRELMSIATPQQIQQAEAVYNNLPMDKQQLIRNSGMQPAHFWFHELAKKQIEQTQAARANQNGMMMNRGQNTMQGNMQMMQQRMPGMQQQNQDMNLQALFNQHAMNNQNVAANNNLQQQLQMNQMNQMNNRLGLQGMNGQVNPSLLGLQQGLGNGNQAQSALQAQVLQQRTQQMQAQMNQNRPAAAMNLMGQVSGQNSMSLLTQPLGQGQQQQPQQANLQAPRPNNQLQQGASQMGQLGQMNQMGQLGTPGGQRPGMPQNSGPRQQLTQQQQQQQQQRLSEIPQAVTIQQKQMLLTLPEQEYRSQIKILLEWNKQKNQGTPLQQGMGTPNPQMGAGAGQAGMNRPQQQPGQQPQQMPVGMMTQSQGSQLIAEWDREDFPRTILDANNLTSKVPLQVKTWGQLKNWVAQQNAPGLGQKLQQLQITVKRNNPQSNMQAQMANQGNPTMGQMPQGGQMIMPNAQAEPQRQLALVFNNLYRAVSKEELTNFRARFQGHDTKSDDDIRRMIARNKITELIGKQKAGQGIPMQLGQGLGMGQMQQPVGQRMGQMGMGGQPLNGVNGMRTPQPQPQAMPTMPPQQAPDMKKRPSSEAFPEQTPAVANAQQQGVRATQQQGVQTPQEAVNQQIIRSMSEVAQLLRTQHRQIDNPQPLPPQLLQQYKLAFEGLDFPGSQRDIKMHLKLKSDYGTFKQLLLDRGIVQQQLKDGMVSPLQSVPLERFQQSANRIKQLQSSLRQMTKSAAQQQTPAPTAPTTKPAAGGASKSPPQTNAQRKPSVKGAKAPPAPTTGPGQHPGFFPSGSGAPTYFQESPQMDLKHPTKRIKRGNQVMSPTQSTPQSNAGSPTVAPSPVDAKRPTPAATPVEIKPEFKFKCDKQDCEFHSIGFENQVQLESHRNQAHPEMAEFSKDPSGYTVKLFAQKLGLNHDGTPKKSPPTANKAIGDKTKASPPASQSMARTATQQSMKASPAMSSIKTPQQQKAQAPTSAPKTVAKESPAKAEADSFDGTDYNPDLMASIFNFDAFHDDAFIKLGTDSSPSALTPSSSKSSNSRESDILESADVAVAVQLETTAGGEKRGLSTDIPAPAIISAADWNLEAADLAQAGIYDGLDMSVLSFDPTSLLSAEVSEKKKDGTTLPEDMPFQDMFDQDKNGIYVFDAMDWEGNFGDHTSAVQQVGGSGNDGILEWDEFLIGNS